MIEVQIPMVYIPHLREMIRQQIRGDRELLLDVWAGREISADEQTLDERLRCLHVFDDQLCRAVSPDASAV